MIFSYIYTLILLLKFILLFFLKIFALNNQLLKIVSIIILSILLILLLIYPRKRFNKLSKLRKARSQSILKYCIYTISEHVYNIIIIISFISIFCIGFIFLRFYNFSNKLDLKLFYVNTKLLLQSLSYSEITLNIFLLSLSFIIYLILLARISSYFKFHVIKRHLFHVGYIKYSLFYLKYLYELDINKYILTICDKINYFYERHYFNHRNKVKPLNYSQLTLTEQIKHDHSKPVEPYIFSRKYKIYYTLHFLVYKGHYIIILLCILLEILYHNWCLETIFKLMPFIYIYDLFIRISIFISQLYIPYDEIIHKFMYNSVILLNKELAYFGNDLVSLKDFQYIYKNYILKIFRYQLEK